MFLYYPICKLEQGRLDGMQIIQESTVGATSRTIKNDLVADTDSRALETGTAKTVIHKCCQSIFLA